jgi:hypothetical protein
MGSRFPVILRGSPKGSFYTVHVPNDRFTPNEVHVPIFFYYNHSLLTLWFCMQIYGELDPFLSNNFTMN